MLLSKFFEEHFAPVCLARCKQSTVKLYRQVLDLWIAEEILDDIHIDQITPRHCADFVSLQLKLVSPDTVAKYCRHLNTMFLRMAKPGYRNRQAFGFLENPPYCQPPRLMKRLPKEVGDRQLMKHIQALGDCKDFPKCVTEELRPKWWKALCLFAATTALRRGAIFAATWDFVDLRNNLFIVSPEIDKVCQERVKFLHPNLVKLLLEIRTPVPRLFHWTHGNKAFYRIWGEACEVSGFKLKLHDLKRYATQLAIRSGADVPTLKEFCDHADIATTLKQRMDSRTRQTTQATSMTTCNLSRKVEKDRSYRPNGSECPNHTRQCHGSGCR